MEFLYVAANQNGVKQKGLLEANSEKEVVAYLQSNKLIPITIKNHEKMFSATILGINAIKNSDLVLFTRQLSSMIVTGITLLEALTLLKNQTTKPQMRNVINDLVESVSNGETFSKALAAHPKVFSRIYIALIQAAETSGLFDKILARLADNLEKSEDLKKRVKSAFFYPAIVVMGIAGVIVVMNVFVIPQLGKLYEGLNINLPFTTRLVLGFSKLTTQYIFLILPIFIGVFVFYRQFKKTDSGKRTFDRVKLKLPVLGSIFLLSVLNEMSRTLSLLINSGSSIIQSINITAQTSENIWYRDALLNTAVLVEKGVNISDALTGQKIFPPLFIQMVKVGESTGKIDESLLRVADYFERDLDLKVKTLTTSIEPILIVTLGVTVGFIILSVITPIYSLISNIQ